MLMIFHVFLSTMLPLLAMIMVGFILDRKFELNIPTLTKISFYIITPCFIFTYFFNLKLDNEMIMIFVAGITILGLNYLLGKAVGNALAMPPSRIRMVESASMFNNSGNLGVALILFIFGNSPYVINGQTPYLAEAVNAQIAIFLIQNISINTIGFYQANRSTATPREAIRRILHMPAIYVPFTVAFFRLLHIDVTTWPIWQAMKVFSGAFVAMAMFSLGILLSRTPMTFLSKEVLIPVLTRLLGGPVIACLTIFAFSLLGMPLSQVGAQAVFIIYSTPCAVNLSLIAAELGENTQHATQVVITSTVISAITLPLAITAAYYLYPL